MALTDVWRNLQEQADHNSSRWLLVVVGVLILLRFKLLLFAAALPVIAYWHYSNQPEDQAEGPEGEGNEADDGDEDPADADGAWPAEDDLGDEDAAFGADTRDMKPDGEVTAFRKEIDPYDQSFWAQRNDEAQPKRSEPKRNAPWRKNSEKDESLDNGDDLDDRGRVGSAATKSPVQTVKDPLSSELPWDADPSDDFLGGGGGAGARNPMGGGLGGGLGGRGGGLDDDDVFGLGRLGGSLGKTSGGGDGLGGGMDFDFLGGGNGDDMDFLGGGSGGKGKGKGKGKKGDGKGKPFDPTAPREANPKQVFVANVADMEEEDIRAIFEEVGEVDRLKVLRTPEGASKGVCFVTFRTEDQAQKALTLHGTSLEGRNLVVRLAHGGNPPAKGEKGDKGGGRGFGSSDRFGDRDRDRDRDPLDLGGSERFGAAFGGDRDRDRDERERGGKGKGRGKGPGGGRRDRGEMDELLEEALQDADGPLKPGDFDFAARRFLSELRSRDRSDGTERFQEALDMVFKYTSSKDRSSVRKWPAYVFTLLQKFDPSLWDELREKDAERRQNKGSGGFGREREPRERRMSDEA